MVHSGDHEGVGVACKIVHIKNQPQFSQKMMEQYWLGKAACAHANTLSDQSKVLLKVAKELQKAYHICVFKPAHGGTLLQNFAI